MKRFDAYKIIAEPLNDELFVTGSFSRAQWEFYAIKDRPTNFYVYHSMGMVSSVALGLALARQESKVVAIDGDGALLMNLGSLVTIANEGPKNLILIVIDNECYETTGGQPTATAGVTNLDLVAEGAGIENVTKVTKPDELKNALNNALQSNDLHLILVKVEKGNADVPECKLDPIEITHRFRRSLSLPI